MHVEPWIGPWIEKDISGSIGLIKVCRLNATVEFLIS